MDPGANKNVAAALADLPAPLQQSVRRGLERLPEIYGDSLMAPHVTALMRVMACSEFATGVICRDHEWLTANVASFRSAPDPQWLDAIVTTVGAGDMTEAEAKARLRVCRNRYLLHVLWREVMGLAELDETLVSLSRLADRLLDAATCYAEVSLRPRFGRARTAAGRPVPLMVLAMGKLGGQELNFSSDIDLIFLYAEGGETDGDKCISAQEYFGRLTRLVIALLDEHTVDGFVFRIDTRLRPFGDSGPPVVSLRALESYLLQHGRDWERYAYVKARLVGPQPAPAVAEELCSNLIRPFVYRRYIDYGVFESLREMHAMIAAEVQRRELQDNIKLGPGGIREAEFIVQSLQLVRGGRDAGLQEPGLQAVLPRLVSGRGLAAEDADQLLAAYRFLRRLENFIQAIRDRQTHELPHDAEDRERLCLAMNFADWDELLTELDRHREAISAQFDRVAFRERGAETALQQLIARAWRTAADEEEWTSVLEQAHMRCASQVATELVAFANAAATRQIDAVSRERLQRFVPELVLQVGKAARPREALARTLVIVEQVLRRSAYLALLNENQAALARLVDLCARSQYIAEQIARHPMLLDELLDPRIFSEAVTRADLAAELRQRLAQSDSGDSEEQMQKIAQFQRATMFRIAVADFNGSLPIMKVSDSLTWLAETVLDEALRLAWDDLVARHGVPRYVDAGESCKAGFGIIAYGKLGGLELSYGSDLDVVFLHDSHGSDQVTDGDRPLDNTMFFARLVRRLVHFLTTQTGSGEIYEIDTRLRPDGRSGLLVTSVDAFERYQEDNAWTWEHQALLRARAVGGSASIAKAFESIRVETLRGRVRHDTLRADVISMRQRMRKELDRSNSEQFDLKHGWGGIGDIEFLVQYLVLENARDHPDVIVYSDNIRQLDALTAAGCMPRDIGDRLQDAYRDYRLRQHHLVLDGKPPLIAAGEFGAERELVAAAWKRWLS